MNPYLYRARNLRAYIDAGAQIAAMRIARAAHMVTMRGSLSGVLCQRGGRMVDLGLLGVRVVTDAGVAFLVDDWDTNAQDITTFNFHDSGTGTTAEAASQTGLITQAGPATRATGTKSQPSAPVIRSVGTISYTGTLAITEHGLFNQAAQGAGSVLWDRTLFSAINVINGDSIQFTYDLTVNAGG